MKKDIDQCNWTTDVKPEQLRALVLYHFKHNNPHTEDENIFSDIVQRITSFAEENRLDIHQFIEYVIIPFAKDF